MVSTPTPTSTPFCLRWGILATGTIAATPAFARDLLHPPSSRSVTDVSHLLLAVASSRSTTIAQQFITRIGASSTIAYGSYESLVADPRIDAVYIASPHSHHYQNAMLALRAGKHVLCEKAFTVTANQAQRLMDTARERGCFLMEGLWTRLLPIAVRIRQEIEDGVIGSVVRVVADNSIGTDALHELRESYLTKRELAGGALMDLGVYPIHWILQALHQLPDRKPSTILSTMVPLGSAGVDESTMLIMTFPANPPSPASVQAIASASLRATGDSDGETPVVRIQGDEGEIQVYGRPWCPSKYRIVKREQRFGMVGEVDEFQFPIPGGAHGLCFEADEVARCVRDGRLESMSLPWEETLLVMGILDEVRRANGLSFPDTIESDKYPVPMAVKQS
ncbi:dimeric dihydrodiol dehydrogenase [Aspergillus sclerotioniger CBS 115572]|uniref:D-xylose 1-dehydrogenase (NADP(+), D-xylono-1,5-lactone-forming) n=1 Tax=Aspergillus sclerotioniger CBS 115572 TaxID=1450535 RepID=A0A317UYF2_9EURO|nr:dimeric dihydrodiol dehydrogenase [Aspergillus sclerotioniger CBS 115572]PWY67083.1 dimeric dihydrodiol dehydrogenase [Aspergillus sclerotioniger CBS 115572]